VTIIQPKITITGPMSPLPDAIDGQPYSVAFTESHNAPFPVSWSINPGLLGTTMSAQGVLSGTPEGIGRIQATVVAVLDNTIAQATATYVVNAYAGQVVVSGALPVVRVGSTYSSKVSATPSAATWTLVSGSAGLPPGITFNASTGTFSGTPTVAGSYPQLLQADFPNYLSGKATLPLDVSAGTLSILQTSIPGAGQNQPYQATLTPVGGVPPYTWSIRDNIGMTIGTGSGTITGTPVSLGTALLSVTLYDAASEAVDATLSLVVAAPLSVATTTLPGGLTSAAYTQLLAAAGGQTPYNWALSSGSTLPPGLLLSSEGSITGSPTVNGLYTFSVEVTDAARRTATATLSISVGPGPVVTSVLNAYNQQSGLSPGVLALVSGSGFGTSATNLAVVVGGKPAYVYPAGVVPNQFQIEIPAELAAGPTTLTVSVTGLPSAPVTITLATYAPACQAQSPSGAGLGKILTGAGQVVTLTMLAHPGDQLSVLCTGLGPTNPPTMTGVAAAANPTAAQPTATVGQAAAEFASASVVAGSAGVDQVHFTVPSGAQGTEPLVISIGGTSSPASLTIAVTGLSAIVNNASFTSPGVASPGSIATAFANSLGTNTDTLAGLFPAAQSEGVQLSFNGIAAPMFHLVASAAQQQVDLLVPAELPTSGTVNVQLSTSTGVYPNYTLTVVPANPGFYRIPDPNVPGRFNVIAQFANTTWLALPASMTTALGLPACISTTEPLTQCGQPAAIGDYLVIYATGLGLTTPNGDPNGHFLTSGQFPPADGSVLYKTPTTPVVAVGGVSAAVLYSGLAPGFPGLYQIDIQVPPGVASGDDVPVQVTILGASDTATISVQPRTN
jgi:uncharacterized protein (TIGR03437 family)